MESCQESFYKASSYFTIWIINLNLLIAKYFELSSAGLLWHIFWSLFHFVVFLVLAAPILEVSSPSPDSILVQWEAVYMAIGFSVSIMQANGLGKIWKENTTNTSLTFSNLNAGTLYTIKAYAWNAKGIPGDDSTCNQRTSKEFLSQPQIISFLINEEIVHCSYQEQH